MKIIEELDGCGASLYCGSNRYIGCEGQMDDMANVAADPQRTPVLLVAADSGGPKANRI